MKDTIAHEHVHLDRRLVKVAKNIKILNNLSWRPAITNKFLRNWRAKKPKLPLIDPQPKFFPNEKLELKAIMRLCDRRHPVGVFLYETSRSYLSAIDLLENIGKTRFTKISCELYGSPKDSLGSSELTVLDAADHLIRATKGYIKLAASSAEDFCLLPEYVAEQIRKPINKFFKHHKVKVVVDPKLAAKAVASDNTIKIRSFTCFSAKDIPQLIQHEAFVHVLTTINGKAQPHLKSLSLITPRTTATQEGLAVFAELITNSMDLHRLRRISLRAKGVDLALNGADFLDVFKFFMAAGQNELESFQSTARIFRGGTIHRHCIFTKDSVYLRGFVEVHGFLHQTIHAGQINYPHYLCAGKLSTADIPLLEPLFESGFIARATYEPPWMLDRSCLLAFLLYSAFAMKLKLHKVPKDKPTQMSLKIL